MKHICFHSILTFVDCCLIRNHTPSPYFDINHKNMQYLNLDIFNLKYM